ncbi:MAG: hypothetical protein ACKPGB_02510 [Dolichospermum sp.]
MRGANLAGVNFHKVNFNLRILISPFYPNNCPRS